MTTPVSSIPSALYTLVARRIRQQRRGLRLTQAAAAAQAGLPLRTYRRFESTGRGNVETLYAIAYALQRGRAIENIFPLWQEPKAAEAVKPQVNGSRPLAGPSWEERMRGLRERAHGSGRP